MVGIEAFLSGLEDCYISRMLDPVCGTDCYDYVNLDELDCYNDTHPQEGRTTTEHVW